MRSSCRCRVFTQPRPFCDISWIEIPQRSSLLPAEVCYPFCRKHGKASSNETARFHPAARRRGRLATWRRARRRVGGACRWLFVPLLTIVGLVLFLPG